MTQQTAVVPNAGLAGTEGAILQIVHQVLGRSGIGLDDDLFDHGATSLSFVRVLAQINAQLHVMVHVAALGGAATARNLAAQVADSSGSAIESRGA
jgi:hypothetical protein